MTEVVFVGVTTGSSLAHQAMVRWRSLIGTDVQLRGVDVPIDAPDDTYTTLLDEISRDPAVRGAVVTTHKLRLFESAHGRFSRLDPLAIACNEVNAVKRRDDGSLEGWARDPVSVGRVVDQIWPETSGQVVCLGAGGTAVALVQHLLATRTSVRIVCADRHRSAAARVARLGGHSVRAHVGGGPWDNLLADAPPGSLIVNATGLGKDRPGSPITNQAQFPVRATVWELNYRGHLTFLDRAHHEAHAYELDVHDGWDLFCHGWAAALGVVFGLADTPQLGERFIETARSLRPTH
ncbi:MAG: shikimate dehydrogenase [Acidimicrobiaceae bacterium]